MRNARQPRRARVAQRRSAAGGEPGRPLPALAAWPFAAPMSISAHDFGLMIVMASGTMVIGALAVHSALGIRRSHIPLQSVGGAIRLPTVTNVEMPIRSPRRFSDHRIR